MNAVAIIFTKVPSCRNARVNKILNCWNPLKLHHHNARRKPNREGLKRKPLNRDGIGCVDMWVTVSFKNSFSSQASLCFLSSEEGSTTIERAYTNSGCVLSRVGERALIEMGDT